MSFIDVIVAKIAPHDCLGCGLEGELLCPRCLSWLKPATQFNHPLPPALNGVSAAVAYAGLAKKLIWRLKYDGAQAAAKIMAQRMEPLLVKSQRTVLVSVPTATSRVRQRGYDQARLLARELAKQARLPWMDCLARQGQMHQVGANREQRLKQLSKVFRVTQGRFVRGAHIILIDDVVTTGATLEAAARVLTQAGAAQIDALAFAISE